MANSDLPLLLTAYGLPYTMGYIPLKDGSVNPSPWTVSELIDVRLSWPWLGLKFP
jgi:hypothetical protein